MLLRDLASVDVPSGVRSLGPADVGQMLACWWNSPTPGPFSVRTIDLGGYVGVFDGDRLVAMAGQRLAPLGSARLARCAHIPTSAAGASPPGSPLLCARSSSAANDRSCTMRPTTTPPAAYEAIGFQFRRQVVFAALGAPWT